MSILPGGPMFERLPLCFEDQKFHSGFESNRMACDSTVVKVQTWPSCLAVKQRRTAGLDGWSSGLTTEPDTMKDIRLCWVPFNQEEH
ncbi:hypothetical protein RRG08_021258 [Elysia crispata]|uniref:Uncharacterized protein n=1 Tax=Elysia crispata TaxID=231223 RepID=A0AAE0YUK6_9GAST|nr:hypothetical protein RRG08_021258 [Elysia crispata]